MKQQSTIDWLSEQLKLEEWDRPMPEIPSYLIRLAKDREAQLAQEYVSFCFRCDRGGMKLLDFKSYINLESK